MYDEDEILDLFDKDEKVIGQVQRGEYYKHRDKYPGYLRAAEVFIQNDEGKLWVPRRAADKKVAPNCLDYSAGGHVVAGEDYAASCLREVEEELNLRLNESDLKLLKKFTPMEDEPWFRALFLYRSNAEPIYNPEDFQTAYWLTPHELIAQLEAGEPAKTSMLASLRDVMDKL